MNDAEKALAVEIALGSDIDALDWFDIGICACCEDVSLVFKEGFEDAGWCENCWLSTK